MSRCGARKRRRLRPILYRRQGGTCFWCGVSLLLVTQPQERWRYATIDHIDEKDSPNKGKHSGKRRKVLACGPCNHDRAHHPLEVRLMMADQAAWSLERMP